MTVCRAGAAVELADNRTDKFVMRVFSLNVINDESRSPVVWQRARCVQWC